MRSPASPGPKPQGSWDNQSHELFSSLTYEDYPDCCFTCQHYAVTLPSTSPAWPEHRGQPGFPPGQVAPHLPRADVQILMLVDLGTQGWDSWRGWRFLRGQPPGAGFLICFSDLPL